MSVLIYPVCASWVRGDGWLKQLGALDASGAGPVHTLGGICGLVGTLILGPRVGVFENKMTID
jgi:Amt family ammonium transporter